MKGIVKICVLVWGISILAILPEVAWEQNKPVRLELKLNNLEERWLFKTDPQQLGEKEGWFLPDFTDKDWLSLRVPGYWEEQGVTSTYPGMPCPELAPEINPLNAYNGTAWYRLRVVIPKDWEGEDLELFIGAVDDLDWTYFNGRLVGKTGEGVLHPAALSRLYSVPRNLVKFGDENVIVLRVWDGGGPGGIQSSPIYLLPKSYLSSLREQWWKGEEKSMSLQEEFKKSPERGRILQIIHNFPKDPGTHEGFLLSLKSRGFGGIVCNVHFDDYLRSEENWKAFRQGVEKAKELGMVVWLYDEQGYPSGAAGGLVLEGHPEWEALGLACVKAKSKGEPIDLKLPEGETISVRAYPLIDEKINLKGSLDLKGYVNDQRELKWNPPEGNWEIIGFVTQRLFEGTHAQLNLFAKRPYINLLMPEPTERFISLTHQQYANRFVGLRNWFKAIFTDEPSLMNVFMSAQPYPVIPWSPQLRNKFLEYKGYDLIPYLPALFANIGPETGRIRCDFWDLIGKLVSENYFQQIQNWCKKNGIASTGHLLAEESLASHVGFYGDFFRCAKYLDIPGIDCLTSKPAGVPWHIAKLLGSIAHLYGYEETMSETSDFVQRYRGPGDTRPLEPVSAEEIKGTCNLLYVGGINTITSYYSWHGLNSQQQCQINEYIGRLSLMLRGGRHICDIAVFYPIESIWRYFVPAVMGATQSPQVAEIEHTYMEISNQLFRHQRDFDYIDSDSLRRAQVVGNSLKVRREYYRIIILPQVETIPLEIWQKIAEFWRRGGVVIAVAGLPENSLANFPDKKVQDLTREIFGSKAFNKTLSKEGEKEPFNFHSNKKGGVSIFISPGNEFLLPKLIDSVVEPDLRVSKSESPLRYCHFEKAGKEIYFIINHSTEPVEETLFLSAEGEPEIWDPETGEISKLNDYMIDQTTGMTKLSLKLNAYGGTFVVFPKSRRPKRLMPSERDFPRIRVKLLRDLTGGPIDLKPLGPEHIKTKITQENIKMKGQSSFLVDCEITVGGIDSWCFPMVTIKEPQELLPFLGLRFWSYVPEGQESCGARLLVILHERGGADYIADASRPLNLSGWKQSTLWFNSFILGGWSKDENDKLDLDQIESIGIGWGGYYGKTSEKICFALDKQIELIGLEGR